MPTLRQLRYLTALAQHRHFGRAAETCAVTQPALSMQVRELEQELGVQLVERRPGDVMLTDIGTEIAQRAQTVLISAQDLVDFARHYRKPLSGRLQLGVIPSLAPYILPKILPAIQRDYPELQIELRETITKVLIDELARGPLDAVLLALPIAHPEIATAPLFEDSFLLAVPSTDPRSPKSRVTAGEVDEDRLILLEEGHCLRDQAIAYCATPRRSSPVRLGATSLTTVMQMVANGYGLTLLPEIAADVEMHDPRVKLLRFAPPEPGRTIGIAWRTTSPRTADVETLAALVTRMFSRKKAAPRKG